MNNTYVFKKFETEDSLVWNHINTFSETSTFLTNLDWINFQKSLGKNIDQYLIFKDNATVGILYVEIVKRKFSKFAYSPYGPVLDWGRLGGLNSKNLENFLKDFKLFAKKYAKNFGLNCFRLDPYISFEFKDSFKNLGFIESLAPAQAKNLWEIDLTQSLDQIRSDMSKSTRYNINKTVRSEIKIIKASNVDEVKAFASLMVETTSRKGFANFSSSYFVSQFKDLNSKNLTDVYLAKYKGIYIAGALINYHKHTAFYTHGCSTSNRELSKLRAPYLLQWRIINEQKEKGFKKYNFWGVLPANLKRHAMIGVSEYKRSFGGSEVKLVGALDVVSDNFGYNLQRAMEWWIYRSDRF